MILKHFKELELIVPIKVVLIFVIFLAIYILVAASLSGAAFAATVSLPGEDAATKMESAATLLRFIDTGLFKWSARILAGLCIFSSGWSLKEMRFGPAVICLVAAILFGTAPNWVRNIFSLSNSDSVFSQIQLKPLRPLIQGESDYA